MKKITLLLCLCATLLFSFTACQDNSKPNGLVIKEPTQRIYFVNDTELKLEGGTVALKYPDGKVDAPVALSDSQVQVTGFNASTAGEKTITVKYKEQTGTFTITVQNVQEMSAQVNALPYKTTYGTYVNASHINLLGGTFDILNNNLTVSRTVQMTAQGVSVESVEAVNASTKKVNLKYDGYVFSFEINIDSAVTGHLAVKDLPTLTAYRSTATIADVKLNGGSFNPCPQGITGNEISMTASGVAVSAIDTQKGYVEFTYQGMKGMFAIEVLQVWEDRIEITTVPTASNNYNFDTKPADVSLTGIEAKVYDNNGDLVKTITATDLVATKIAIIFSDTPNKATVTVKYVGDTADLFDEFEINVSLDNIMLVKYYASLFPMLDWINMTRLTDVQEEAALRAFDIFFDIYDDLPQADKTTLDSYKNPILRTSFFVTASRLYASWDGMAQFFPEEGMTYNLIAGFKEYTDELLTGIDDCVATYESFGYVVTFENNTISGELSTLQSLKINDVLLTDYYRFVVAADQMYSYIKNMPTDAYEDLATDHTQFTDIIEPVYDLIIALDASDGENGGINVAINLLLNWRSDAVDIIYEYYYYQNSDINNNENIMALLNADVYSYAFISCIYYIDWAYTMYMGYDGPPFLYFYYLAVDTHIELYGSPYKALIAIFEHFGYQQDYVYATEAYLGMYGSYIDVIENPDFKPFFRDFLELLMYGWDSLPGSFPTGQEWFYVELESLILRYYELDPYQQYIFYAHLTYSEALSAYYEYDVYYFGKMMEDYFKPRLLNQTNEEGGLSEYELWQWIDYASGFYSSIHYNGLNGNDLFYFLACVDYASTLYGTVVKSNTFNIYVKPLYDMLNLKYQEVRYITEDLIDIVDLVYYGLDVLAYYKEITSYGGNTDAVANYLLAFYFGANQQIENYLFGADSTMVYYYEEYRFVDVTIREMFEILRIGYQQHLGRFPAAELNLYGSILFDSIFDDNYIGSSDFVSKVEQFRDAIKNSTVEDLELMFMDQFYGMYFDILYSYYAATIKVGGQTSTKTVNALMMLEQAYYLYLFHLDAPENERILLEFYYLMNMSERELNALNADERAAYMEAAPAYNAMHAVYLNSVIPDEVFDVYKMMNGAYNAFYNAIDGNGDFTNFLIYYYKACELEDNLSTEHQEIFVEFFEDIRYGKNSIEEMYSYVVDIYYLENLGEGVTEEEALELETFLKLYAKTADAFNTESANVDPDTGSMLEPYSAQLNTMINELLDAYYALAPNLQFMFRAGVSPNDYPEMIFTFSYTYYGFASSERYALRYMLLSEFYYLGSQYGVSASQGYYYSMFESSMAELEYYYNMFKDNTTESLFITHYGEYYDALKQILDENKEEVA